MGTEQTSPVIRPARTRVTLEESGTGIEFRRRGMGVASWFLFLWLIGWSVGCVWLAYEAIFKFKLFLLLFGIPFWASWFLVAGILVYGLFGFEGLRVERSGVQSWKGVGGWRFRDRHVPLRDVITAERHTASYQVNDRPVYGVQIRTRGKPVVFGTGLSDDEREWIIERLNSALVEVGVAPAPAEPVSFEADPQTPEAVDSEPPADTDWRVEIAPQAAEFSRRGRFSLAAVGGLVFTTLFWNGILSVFLFGLFGGLPSGDKPVDVPAGAAWWGILIFLIPFIVIGLGMVVALLGAITQPLWRNVLRLERHEIASSYGLLNLRRTRRIAPQEIGAIQIRRSGTANSATVTSRGDQEWELVIADRSMKEALRIKSITQGEAEWIAASIREAYPHVLSLKGTSARSPIGHP